MSYSFLQMFIICGAEVFLYTKLSVGLTDYGALTLKYFNKIMEKH